MIKSFFKQLISLFRSRVFIVAAVFVVLFLILFHRVFVLQIVNGEEYLEEFTYRIQKEVEIDAPRGTIYDCNGVALAYDRLAYSVIIEDSTLLTDNESKNEMIEKLIDIVEENGQEAVNNVPMTVDDDGNVIYNGSDSTIRSFKKDIYGLDSTDSLSDEQEEMTAQELYDYMRSEDFFDISDEFSTEETLKIIAIRYELYMKRYQKYVSVTVATDVSDEMVAAIKENSSDLPGVTIEEDYIREYYESEYFSNITGYIGTISEEQLEEFEADGYTDYDSSDTVGKTGIESVYEYVLAGTKGSETLYVDSTGSILDTSDVTEAVAGNDVYLTIDAELTMEIYDLLEEKIAGILLAKLSSNVDEDNNEDNLIDYSEVFYALIDNGVIDTEHFYESDATELEASVGERFDAYLETVMAKIESELVDETFTPQGELSDEYDDYFTYIYTWLKSSEILDGDQYDSDEEVYAQWIDGEISLGEFLKHAISEGWIDSSLLDVAEGYVDTSEVYDALASAIIEGIRDDGDFQDLVYDYVISAGEISEKEICLLLYDQGVLSESDDDYESLSSGSMSARSFIYNKIYDLEITPAMLGLDLCSGAVVITDVDTGDVKALVSYPGYDANQISDSEYYASLLENESTPLFNRATQQTCAPGSTYKMLSAICGLEEGLITTSTTIYDEVEFDKVTPSASCWNEYGHGSINVTQAIEYSCNYFFYELGYEASLTSDGYMSDTQGLELLAEYAEMFGFGQTTGIEIGEASPQISDESSVRSFIGQGTNDYTPTQINRYTAAVANEGTVYNLTLIDTITEHDGTVVEENEPEVLNDLTDTISDTTWDAVHEGMYLVCYEGSNYKNVFTSLDITVAGKSGTAQESESEADHAWYTGYAPYDDPEIAVTVLIPYGYGSSNIVDTFRNSIAAYYDLPLYDSVEDSDETDSSERHAQLPINYSTETNETDDGDD